MCIKFLTTGFRYIVTVCFIIVIFKNSAHAQNIIQYYNIKQYGAKAQENFLNTNAINTAIKDAANHGGGTVVIPKGIFTTATIYLKSKVNLLLEKDAVLQGAKNINLYKSFIPTHDLTKYSTISTEGNNSNSAYDTSWTKALIIGDGIQNVTISGEGIIDGVHVTNPKGEEGMRGAHTIILSNSKNITWCNITIERAGNYAILGYSLENIVFQNIHIKEGWDGIHIRGGENILIRNSVLETGDDAIAGGYWHNFVVTDSKINSSCNGIRVIMPIDGVTIKNDQFVGPGAFAHRTSGAAHRTNMLAGIYIQPGGWGETKGDIKNVCITDVNMHNMDNLFMFDLNKGNNASNVQLKNIVADSIIGAIYIHSHNGGIFDSISLDNIVAKFIPPSITEEPWAMSVNNVPQFHLNNIHFSCTNINAKKAIRINNVAFPIFQNVQITPKSTSETIEIKNSGDIKYN